MANIKILFRIVLLFALTGCAATGPIFQQAPPPQSGKSLVYLYRPGSFMLGGRDAHFYINDTEIAALSSEGYTYVYLDPGTYKLKQKWPLDLIGFESLELPLVTEPNKTYYYKFYSGERESCPEGKICFEWSLGKVSEQGAKSEISICHYQPAN